MDSPRRTRRLLHAVLPVLTLALVTTALAGGGPSAAAAAPADRKSVV